ncbi:uncharacterized protein LOC113389821 [Ctenocephalides felis]|uniref:uncharacterized protein LOC113389821 n=1 Tax=Ctenocephalides felis TaxID=7515 RepID=UPI000E6E1124|nr:uncharacterized protein LOC113389821 [Ctenocephalides felis]
MEFQDRNGYKVVNVFLCLTISQISAIYVPFGTKTNFAPNSLSSNDDYLSQGKNQHTNLYYKKIYVNPYYLVPYPNFNPLDQNFGKNEENFERRADEVDQDYEEMEFGKKTDVDRDYYEQTKSKKTSKKAIYDTKSKNRQFGTKFQDKYYIKVGDGKFLKSTDFKNINNNNGDENNRYYRLKDEVKPVWERIEDDVTQRNNYKFVLPEPRIKKTWD